MSSDKMTAAGIIPGLNGGTTSSNSLAIWPHINQREPGLIFKKMSLVMKDIGSVKKDQKNLAQGFKFRGVDQFVNALYPALTAHGVFMAPRAISYTSELKDVVRGSGKAGTDKHVSIMMEYDFFAEDGSKVTVGPIPAEGLDSGDKATNKALSAALKYALIQTFSVPTEDMAEADLESPEISGANKTPVAAQPNVEATPATPAAAQLPTAPVAETPKAEAAPATPKRGSPFRKQANKAVETASAASAPKDEWGN